MNNATVEFINKSIKAHGVFYDYSLSNYQGSNRKIDIICPKHGVFSQRARNHYHGYGCIYCAKEKFVSCGKNYRFDSSQSSNTAEFIEKAKKVHGRKYNYKLVQYNNSKQNVKIICKEHGIFEQRPDHHLAGNDCSACMNKLNESKKLIIIDDLLEKSGLSYVREKTFIECKLIKMLRFDRYVKELNLCIEYDGEQHFKKNEFFGGEDSLKKTQKRDRIKNKYCRENNVNLLRIKFNEDPIEQIEKMINKIKADENQVYHIFYGKQKRIKNVA